MSNSLPWITPLATWLPSRRWYAGKDHEPQLSQVSCQILDATPSALSEVKTALASLDQNPINWILSTQSLTLNLAAVEDQIDQTIYQIPFFALSFQYKNKNSVFSSIKFLNHEKTNLETALSQLPGWIGASYNKTHQKVHAYFDALTWNWATMQVIELVLQGFADNPLFLHLEPEVIQIYQGELLGVEQSNSSVIFKPKASLLNSELKSDYPTLLAKFFRILKVGNNPDVEIPCTIPNNLLAKPVGYLGYQVKDQELGRAHYVYINEFLSGSQPGWDLAVTHYAASQGQTVEIPSTQTQCWQQIGTALGTLHSQIASSFGKRSANHEDRQNLFKTWKTRWESVKQTLVEKDLAESFPAAKTLLEHESKLLERLKSITQAELPALQRIHGDLHIFQVLYLPTEQPWRFIDFEGQPLADLSVRRQFHLPWRDVAGLIRSFDYAYHEALHPYHQRPVAGITGQNKRNEAALVSNLNIDPVAEFLQAYEMQQGLKIGDITNSPLLQALLIEQALYEISYEISFRPAFLNIPLSQAAKLVTNM